VVVVLEHISLPVGCHGDQDGGEVGVERLDGSSGGWQSSRSPQTPLSLPFSGRKGPRVMLVTPDEAERMVESLTSIPLEEYGSEA
jgi:hypothetical protein